MNQADIREMFKKASLKVQASTVMAPHDPCLLLQLLQQQRLQIIQKRILMTINQQ
jgi:hypothetical protein